MPWADPLAQRVVAAVAQHRHLLQRVRPVHQGITEPVRDHAQVPLLGTLPGWQGADV